MAYICSFPALSGSSAKVLILGTMPGEASLRQKQYYGHPRNQFWPIMASVLRFDPSLPYQEKARALIDGGLALWDVVAQCERKGSLDSAIKDEKPNRIDTFLENHRQIGTLLFNGGPAHRLFRKYFRGFADSDAYHIVIMPSTSPACARYSPDEKKACWQEALDVALRAPRHQ